MTADSASCLAPSATACADSQASSPADQHWMQRALALAQSVLTTTTPNPRVGCVIVRDGQLLGAGATQPPGGPHAEIMALRDAAQRAATLAGASVYVTLEPCSHHGRTPPCVEALIAARPSRVVVALADPNPQVNGRGLRALAAAGITVETGVCMTEALALNPGFVARMTRGTPWLWLKLAASLDGRSALPNGVSQWITGQPARADGHHWRARSCLVLTGIGTVRADDPQLTVRHVATPRAPRRAVVDGNFEISESARLLAATDGALPSEPPLVFTTQAALNRQHAKARRLSTRGVQLVTLPATVPGRVNLPALLQWLGAHDINEVHVEAGAGLSGALLAADCVDELLIYQAPILLGQGAGLVDMAPFARLSDAPRFHFFDIAPIGSDLRLRARRAERWDALASACRMIVRR